MEHCPNNECLTDVIDGSLGRMEQLASRPGPVRGSGWFLAWSMPLRVGIIGGGGAGLAALKVLKESPDVFQAVLFEERDGIGGIW